ncbi:MAG: hypothetical protein R2731_11755 [Nocardioides sp.]
MGPKVDAVCRFVERTGRTAVITDLAHIAPVVTQLADGGDVGAAAATVVVPPEGPIPEQQL